MPQMLHASDGPEVSAGTVAHATAAARLDTASRSGDMTKHIILFLSATPSDTTRRKHDAQCAAIQRELQMTSGDFVFESRWSVSVDDLMRHLMDLEPTVIHFSGHGGSAGLKLRDEQGLAQLVTGRALTRMVASAAGSKVRVAVLDADYSAEHAEALRAKVDCVVGMNGLIDDDAAQAFAIRFYYALADGRSVGNAVEQGHAALEAKQLSEKFWPRCLTRDGTDADKVVLLDPR